MCGRYASVRKRTELLEEFGVLRDRVAQPLEPDYNVAPTKPIYAVLTRRAGDDRDAAGDGAPGGTAGRDGAEEAAPAAARELRVVRWGLVPFWAKDLSIGSKLINARAETVATKPAFRRAFARHRCLIPADGYYEWEKVGDPAKPRKQPHYIHRADGGVLAFAGLYELWRDKSLPDDHANAWRWTATIITTRAEDEVGHIHDRMPMVIEPARWSDWLDPEATSPDELHQLLAPAVSARLTSYPVSTEVNSVRHNGPQLIQPAAGEPEPAGAHATASGAGSRERDGETPGAPSALF